jgi:hypothetical protein
MPPDLIELLWRLLRPTRRSGLLARLVAGLVFMYVVWPAELQLAARGAAAASATTQRMIDQYLRQEMKSLKPPTARPHLHDAKTKKPH